MRHSLAAGGLLLGMLSIAGSAYAAGPMSRYYADDTDGIFWFVHITDLHIDTNDSKARSHLEFALNEVVDIVNPVAVFASGDLVDGTILGIPTSGQDPAEWDNYRTLLFDANMEPTFYFDVPGNHDGYGDQGLTNYIESSMQGPATNGRLFVDAVHTTALGEYYFVGMNSAGTFDTPFTFGNPFYTNVDDLAAGLQAHASAQLVFVFAHHHLVDHGDTDAQMVLGIGGADDPPGNVSEVLPLLEDSGAFYLHGHVHQYKESLQGNVVTVQLSNLASDPSVDRTSIESWDQTKFESNIGIGIVDHNAFVYGVTDTTSPWPFVAITAPVDVNLEGGGTPPGSSSGVSYDGDYLDYGVDKNPYAYDVCGARTDNPVRALVLSKEPVGSVSVSLDGSVLGLMAPAADPPGIYTATIDTSAVAPGLHDLTVTVVLGNEARSDSIQVNLTSGPCDPLGDAGVDAEPDAPGSDANLPDAGADAPAADADQPENDADLPPESDVTGTDDVGCSCSLPRQTSSRGVAGMGAVLFALALLRRRRSASKR
jgi:MYXO-CTERM domain-containing protein